MVFFTCNHCGESLKKQAVEKHGWRCKQNSINVSCMDCQKDFIGKAYDAHTSCISELEKYSGKDYVPKANANKGAKKQEAWINTIRSITNRKKDLSRGVSEVFNVIRNNDNIPRKQKGFLNFFQNSAKHIKLHDVQAAWSLLEDEVKISNANNNGPQQHLNGTDPSKANGEINVPAVNGANKRKLEDNNNGDIVTEQPAPKKKKKQRDPSSNDQAALLDASAAEGKTLEHEGAAEKFKWRDAIRTTLDAKGNEMKLSKLRKKVLKKYHQFVGSSVDAGDKIERKFSKTITKLGLVVDNETVRLIN